MHRCYLAQPWPSPLAVGGEEAKHALKVMRLRVGDEVELFDGLGRAAIARLVGTQGSSCMQLELVRECEPMPPIAHLTLALAIPKGGNMELIVQKAVELGVARIIPLLTERTVVRLKEGEAEAKRAKWQRVVLEACKQCGVSLLPQVATPQSLAAFLAAPAAPSDGLRLCCAILPQSRPMRELLEPARAAGLKAATILVGPEGDFSPAEYDSILAANFAPASLGPIILRVETACFLALSSARYALD